MSHPERQLSSPQTRLETLPGLAPLLVPQRRPQNVTLTLKWRSLLVAWRGLERWCLSPLTVTVVSILFIVCTNHHFDTICIFVRFLNCFLVRTCSLDYSLHYQIIFWYIWPQIHLSGPSWPSTSCTPQAWHLLLKRGPSLTGRGRASQLSWPGWLRVGEGSCSTGAVPSHFHFIYLPPLSSLPPSIYPFFLPLPVDQCSLHAEVPLCPVSCGRANGISLFLHSLPQRLRV